MEKGNGIAGIKRKEAKPLVRGRFLLKKFPGKGGWTYAELPNLVNQPENPFGWLRVQGSIDEVPIAQYHLMPMGNGHLFLPVKKEIRKEIKKEAGDRVSICLYRDDSPFYIPDDVRACLMDEPEAYEKFIRLPDTEQKRLADQIIKVKKTEIRAEKIASLIDYLSGRKPKPIRSSKTL